jgi:hypothetical protein
VGVMQSIEPWLAPGLHGRVIKFLVLIVFVKIGLAMIAGTVLLVLWATGNL